jgi:Dolichyl-phosphate-mannose-protein mannosyltransferase
MATATPVDESLTRSAPRAEDEGSEGSHRGRRAAIAVLVVLTIQFVAVSAVQAWRDSPTNDEPVSMATGLAALREREVRVNFEAPVFPKAINALPLWVARIPVPLDGIWAEVEERDRDELTGFEWAPFTNEFEHLHLERGDYRRVLFLGRIMPIVQGALIGLVLFALGSALFGRPAGLLAAALWLTTPLAVGFSHLNGLDLFFTLAVLAACLALERHLRRPTRITLAWVALASGLVLLIRHTGVLIVAAVVASLLLAPRPGRPRREALAEAAVVVVAAWALVWVGHLAIAPASPAISYVAATAGSGPVARTASRVVDLIPWPRSYKLGFQYQISASTGKSQAYLLGESWRGVRWWFWPATLAMKLPLAALAVALLGPIAWCRLDRATARRAATVLLPSLVVLVVFLLPFPKQVGVRYALPVIALLFVVGSPVAGWLVASRRRLALVALLMVVQLASFWDATPHSLAWTAPPFRPGYAMAAESSLDWGQDNWALIDWMDGRTVYVAPFGGSLEAVFETPGYRDLLVTAPTDVRGLAAASVTQLTAYYRDQLSWLRAYCNVGTIGGSILLYRFEDPPTPEPGPSRPVGRCSGDVSVRTE